MKISQKRKCKLLKQKYNVQCKQNNVMNSKGTLFKEKKAITGKLNINKMVTIWQITGAIKRNENNISLTMGVWHRSTQQTD